MRSKASGLLRFIKHKPNPFKLVKMRGWSGGKTFCRVFRAALQKRNWTAEIGQELDSADLHSYLCNNRAKTTHSLKHCASAGTHMHAASLPEQWLCICILVLPVHAECQVVQGKEGTWVIWTKQPALAIQGFLVQRFCFLCMMGRRGWLLHIAIWNPPSPACFTLWSIGIPTVCRFWWLRQAAKALTLKRVETWSGPEEQHAMCIMLKSV